MKIPCVLKQQIIYAPNRSRDAVLSKKVNLLAPPVASEDGGNSILLGGFTFYIRGVKQDLDNKVFIVILDPDRTTFKTTKGDEEAVFAKRCAKMEKLGFSVNLSDVEKSEESE